MHEIKINNKSYFIKNDFDNSKIDAKKEDIELFIKILNTGQIPNGVDIITYCKIIRLGKKLYNIVNVQFVLDLCRQNINKFIKFEYNKDSLKKQLLILRVLDKNINISGNLFDTCMRSVKKLEPINKIAPDMYLFNLFMVAPYLRYQTPKNITLPSISKINNYKDGDVVLETPTKFKEKYNKFTNHTLDGLDWNNVIYTGSSLYLLVNPKIKDFPVSSDIDLFVYGDNDVKVNKIKYLCKFFKKKYKNNVFFCREGCVVSVIIKHQYGKPFYRNIQIINNYHKCPYDIIDNFDLSHAQIFYQNGSVYCSRRFAKYYPQMCSKIVTTKCIEYRLYKTSSIGLHLIKNNKLIVLESKNKSKYCDIHKNYKWNVDSHFLINKLNKYYYPLETDSDERVKFLISKIFNTPLMNVNNISDIPHHGYIKNEVNTVRSLLSDLPVKIEKLKNNNYGLKMPEMKLPELTVLSNDNNRLILKKDKIMKKVLTYLDILEQKILSSIKDKITVEKSYKEYKQFICIFNQTKNIIKNKKMNIKFNTKFLIYNKHTNTYEFLYDFTFV